MFEKGAIMRRANIVATCLISVWSLWGQGSSLPLGNDAYRLLERLEIRSGFQREFHSTIKPFDRSAVPHWLTHFDTLHNELGTADLQHELRYLASDNTEWLAAQSQRRTLFGSKSEFSTQPPTLAHRSLEHPRYIRRKALLGSFYKTPANFWEVNSPTTFLKFSPIFQLALGNLRDDPDPYYLNQFGFAVRGGIDDRLFFSFRLLGSRAQFPNYVERLIEDRQSIPGQGTYREHQNDLFNFANGYAFSNSQWQVGFNFTRSSSLQFGRGNNFLGDGYRSLILSDFANNYLHLKLNWKIWKLHYQNIFAELSAGPGGIDTGGETSTKKYLALHILSYNFSKNLNVAVFEAVVLNRSRHFELQYLNPLILYRTVEQSLGSPDNVILGGQAKWNFARHLQLYGQVVFDEIKFSELTSGEGWWGNKFGTQVGLKYIDAFGISHLDLQFERNVVRPFTYTHTDSLAAYTHFDLPLAHPIGANFKENLLLVRYRPVARLQLGARLLTASVGEDEENNNWGNSLLRSNDSRIQEYGNSVGQGITSDILLAGVDLSYQFAHNIFLDLYYLYRNKDSQLNARDQVTHLWGAGLRMNIHKQKMDF